LMKAINYREGTSFFVPLRSGGVARGVVARLDGAGTFLAYFFGPALKFVESKPIDLEPSSACLVGLCGDLGLIKGSWPIAGDQPMWKRECWPVPPLYRQDEKAEKAWLSFYDDRNLALIREEPTSFTGDCSRPYDRLMGYGAAEIRLTKLLSPTPDSSPSAPRG
jgi:hypothetical protein